MEWLRTAAVLHWFIGLGFGIPAALGIRNLAVGRGVLRFLGFPTYGGGPFERVGIPSTVPLLSAFLLVCVLECLAGWLLWSGNTSGAILSLTLLPLGAIFWWGFALPIPPIFAAVWTVLILLQWQQLR